MNDNFEWAKNYLIAVSAAERNLVRQLIEKTGSNDIKTLNKLQSPNMMAVIMFIYSHAVISLDEKEMEEYLEMHNATMRAIIRGKSDGTGIPHLVTRNRAEQSLVPATTVKNLADETRRTIEGGYPKFPQSLFRHVLGPNASHKTNLDYVKLLVQCGLLSKHGQGKRVIYSVHDQLIEICENYFREVRGKIRW